MGGPGFGYTRLSQGGKSIAEQKEMIRDYCDDRGIELLNIFDDGQYESAYTQDRPEYQAMLERVRAGEVENVVVRGLSRLSRDRLHRIELLIQLDRMGVDVHAVERPSNPIDLDEPWALTREAGQADADDVEKRKEADRGREEAERRKADNLPNGRPPYGFEYNDDKTGFEPTDGFETARRAIRLRDHGFSWREIEERVAIPMTTVRRIYDNRDQYLEVA